MPTFVFYAILAALALGGYSVVLKILLRYRVCSAELVTWGVGIGAGLVSAVILMVQQYPFPIDIVWSLVLVAVVLLSASWFLSRALQDGDASTVVPLLSLKIPIVTVMSIFTLGERHGLKVYIAALAAALGVAMFGMGKQQKAQGGHNKHPLLAIVLACLSAFSYALLDQVVKRTLVHIEPVPLTLWANVIVACMCLLMLLNPHYHKYRLERADILLFAGSGILLAGGMLAFVGSLSLSDGVTVPNIVLSTRGFFTLMIGIVLARTTRIPMEKQSTGIYLLRAAGSVLLLVGLIIALV